MSGVWLNTCTQCGTHNASAAFARPSQCSGCGQALVCVQQLPHEANSNWWAGDPANTERLRRMDEEAARMRRFEREELLRRSRHRKGRRP